VFWGELRYSGYLRIIITLITHFVLFEINTNKVKNSASLETLFALSNGVNFVSQFL
jgi:hypothetical protein